MAAVTLLRQLRSKTILGRLQPVTRQVCQALHLNSPHYSESLPKDHSNPLKFTTSNAAAWQAKSSRSGGSDEEMPWFQPYIISLSLTVFLVYFCILREENDIDRQLERTLYDHIEGLEEKQLEISLAYNQDHGIDTKAIEERLLQLEQDKLKVEEIVH